MTLTRETIRQGVLECEMEQASSAPGIGWFCRLLGSLLVRALQGVERVESARKSW